MTESLKALLTFFLMIRTLHNRKAKEYYQFFQNRGTSKINSKVSPPFEFISEVDIRKESINSLFLFVILNRAVLNTGRN